MRRLILLLKKILKGVKKSFENLGFFRKLLRTFNSLSFAAVVDHGTDQMLTSRSLITMIFPLLFNDLITRKNIVFLDKQQGIFFL